MPGTSTKKEVLDRKKPKGNWLGATETEIDTAIEGARSETEIQKVNFEGIEKGTKELNRRKADDMEHYRRTQESVKSLRISDAAETSHVLAEIRGKIGLRQPMEAKAAKTTRLTVGPEEQQALQTLGELVEKKPKGWEEDLKTLEKTVDTQQAGLGKDERVYGGTVETPMEAESQGVSAASFEGIEGAGTTEEEPAMFSLKDIEAQEKAATAKKKPPVAGGSAAA